MAAVTITQISPIELNMSLLSSLAFVTEAEVEFAAADLTATATTYARRRSLPSDPVIDQIIANGAVSATGYLGKVKAPNNIISVVGDISSILNDISNLINLVKTAMTLMDATVSAIDKTVEITKDSMESAKKSLKNNLDIDINSEISYSYYNEIKSQTSSVKGTVNRVASYVTTRLMSASNFINKAQKLINSLTNLQGIISTLINGLTPAGQWIEEQIFGSKEPGSGNNISDYFNVMSDIWDAYTDVAVAVDGVINNFQALGNFADNFGMQINQMFDQSSSSSSPEYDGPLGPAAASSAPSDAVLLDGLGFIWNPRSNLTGKLIITLPTETKTTCQIYEAHKNELGKWKRGDLIEEGIYTRKLSGGTQYRFEKRGGSYNDGDSVWAVSPDKFWFISDPAVKYN